MYHSHRPDVIVGALTTNLSAATAPTDYILQDWADAGLDYPSAFRSYILTLDNGTLPAVGRLSDRDWHEIQACISKAIAFGGASP